MTFRFSTQFFSDFIWKGDSPMYLKMILVLPVCIEADRSGMWGRAGCCRPWCQNHRSRRTSPHCFISPFHFLVGGRLIAHGLKFQVIMLTQWARIFSSQPSPLLHPLISTHLRNTFPSHTHWEGSFRLFLRFSRLGSELLTPLPPSKTHHQLRTNLMPITFSCCT